MKRPLKIPPQIKRITGDSPLTVRFAMASLLFEFCSGTSFDGCLLLSFPVTSNYLRRDFYVVLEVDPGASRPRLRPSCGLTTRNLMG
jgi:hypothetical protein